MPSLRIKEVDFTRSELMIRAGKGDKDRRTMLPRKLVEPISHEIERARALHAQDLAEGFGIARLPHALARKYANAGREPGWRSCFLPPIALVIRWMELSSILAGIVS